MAATITSTDEMENRVMVDVSRHSPLSKRRKLDELNFPQTEVNFSSYESSRTSLQDGFKKPFSGYSKQNNISSPIQKDRSHNLNMKATAIMDPMRNNSNSYMDIKDNHQRKVVQSRDQAHGSSHLSSPQNSDSWSWAHRDEGGNEGKQSDENSLKSKKHQSDMNHLETAIPYPDHRENQQNQQHFIPMPNVIWFNQHQYPPTHPHPLAHPVVPIPYESQQYWMYPVHHSSPARPMNIITNADSTPEATAAPTVLKLSARTESAGAMPWFQNVPTELQGSSSDTRNPGPSLYSQATQYTGLCPSQTALAPYYARNVLPLSTPRDDEWLSAFLCFVRYECIEVFTAGHEDVASRMNSKKVLEDQVGIRCRFCAHIPHRERAGRSSSFPSSISRIYQSLTMMLRDHFPKCDHMPGQVKERYLSLRANASQGATDSKRYWIDSAHELGLLDTDYGIRFAASKPSISDVYASVSYDPYAQHTHPLY